MKNNSYLYIELSDFESKHSAIMKKYCLVYIVNIKWNITPIAHGSTLFSGQIE